MADNVVLSPKGRVAFQFVYDGKENDKGTLERRLILIFDEGTDLLALKAAATEAARKKWGDRIPKNLRSPFRDNGDLADYEGFDVPGTFVTFKTDRSVPVVVDSDGRVLTKESGEFYSGCYARVSCHAYAYAAPQNQGVAFSLHNVQKLADGDPLAGRQTSPEEDFGTKTYTDDGADFVDADTPF